MVSPYANNSLIHVRVVDAVELLTPVRFHTGLGSASASHLFAEVSPFTIRRIMQIGPKDPGQDFQSLLNDGWRASVTDF